MPRDLTNLLGEQNTFYNLDLVPTPLQNQAQILTDLGVGSPITARFADVWVYHGQGSVSDLDTQTADGYSQLHGTASNWNFDSYTAQAGSGYVTLYSYAWGASSIDAYSGDGWQSGVAHLDQHLNASGSGVVYTPYFPFGGTMFVRTSADMSANSDHVVDNGWYSGQGYSGGWFQEHDNDSFAWHTQSPSVQADFNAGDSLLISTSQDHSVFGDFGHQHIESSNFASLHLSGDTHALQLDDPLLQLAQLNAGHSQPVPVH
ncbi:MAG: hypothetical protein JO019_02900 [Candidatus Kaiserbacteria bacterium]|nr:hypothetical protein [Candidatus Kaiserbacteria bacterium]